MTGNQILSAYTEIAKNDLFPVLAITNSGVDSTMAMHYINVGAKRVMRSLRREAKATFSYVDGTNEYNMQTISSKRFFELAKVKVAGSTLCRSSIDGEEGYAVVGDTITFLSDWADGSEVTLVGPIYAHDIVATDGEVTEIPSELHLAVAQFAIVESCGSHDIDPVQQQKLLNMMRLAEDAVQRQRNRDAMNTYPMRLVNGAK